MRSLPQIAEGSALHWAAAVGGPARPILMNFAILAEAVAWRYRIGRQSMGVL